MGVFSRAFPTMNSIGFVFNEEFAMEDLEKSKKTICKPPEPFVSWVCPLQGLASFPLGKIVRPSNHQTSDPEGTQNESQETCHAWRW